MDRLKRANQWDVKKILILSQQKNRLAQGGLQGESRQRGPAEQCLSKLKRMAGTTGLEPAASAVTGQRSNQLNYVP